MSRGTLGTIISVAFIGFASAVLLLQNDPEYVTVESENRMLAVAGFVREAGITVTQEVGEVGDEFTVFSGATDADFPLQLRFVKPYGPAWTGTENFGVLWYDEATTMWEWQDVTTVDDYLIVRTTHLGRFAVADRKVVAAPDFVATYDALRAQAPDGAVGYRIAVGYALSDDGPRIRLDDVGQQGGCNGAVQPGEETAYASAARQAMVLVNDVQTPVTFTFVAAWYIVDGGSCPEGQTFEASEEYGILPASN